MKSLESQFTLQAYGGLTEDLDYHCMFDNKVVETIADLSTKKFTCKVPIMAQACHKVSLMDSFGRKFPYEDPDSSEDTICIIQQINIESEILPSTKLPSDGVHEDIKFTVSPKSAQ